MLRKLLLLSFKLIYKTNQWLQQRFSANGLLILGSLLMAGVFGFNTRATLSFQLFSLLLLLLLAAMSHAIFFRARLTIKRILPKYGTVDTPLQYHCIINNQQHNILKNLILTDSLQEPFPTLAKFNNSYDPLDKKRNWFDRLVGYPRLVSMIQKKRGAHINPANVDYIGKNSTLNIKVLLHPLRRGYLYFDTIRLNRADPLGLFFAQKSFKDKQHKLLIGPKCYRVPNLNIAADGARHQFFANNHTTTIGQSKEFLALRDYHHGDPLKAIHWRSSAKRNKLIVKEYQDDCLSRYGLILDTFVDHHNEALFEDAVSIAASFVIAQQNHTAMDLMFMDHNGQAPVYTKNLFETLACIESCPQKNIDDLTALLRQNAWQYSAFICVLINVESQRQMLLQTLAALHIPLKILLIHQHNQADIKVDMSDLATMDIDFINTQHLQQDLDQLSWR